MFSRRRRLAADAPATTRGLMAGRDRRPGRASVAARAGAWKLARLIQLIAAILAGILVAGILLVVLEANRDNAIVEAVLDAARFLSGPFDNMFEPDDRKVRVAANWGVAAAVYLVVGAVLARLLRR